MISINFIEYPSYEQEINLDNEAFVFKFVWNSRGEFWSLSIFDINKVPIITGIKLVLNYDLLSGLHHLPVPKGELYAGDLSDDVSKIKFDDFTNERKMELIYITEAELATV